MPYIADENADEDPELKAAVLDDSKAAQQLRELFLSRGKPVRLSKQPIIFLHNSLSNIWQGLLAGNSAAEYL